MTVWRGDWEPLLVARRNMGMTEIMSLCADGSPSKIIRLAEGETLVFSFDVTPLGTVGYQAPRPASEEESERLFRSLRAQALHLGEAPRRRLRLFSRR